MSPKMGLHFSGQRRWSVDLQQDWVDVTSEWPTPNEAWVFVDSNGHEHRYDNGYPTLEQIVDAEHECDGHEGFYNHDPHTVIDEAHFVCRECGETIEPKMDPPFTSKQVPGLRSATLKGVRSDGTEVETALTEEELEAINQSSDRDAFVWGFLDSLPRERIAWSRS